LTHDTEDTKDSDQPLKQKLQTLEKGDKVQVNCIDDTLTVQEIRPRVHYEVVLEDSEGITYSLTPHLVRDEVLTIEPSTAFSDQRIVQEIEVVE
jgi:triosephosphate isomerase